MEKLLRERSYARSGFTRAKNNFTQAQAKDPDDHCKVLSFFKIFEDKANKLFEVDQRIDEQWYSKEDFNEEEKLQDDESVDAYRQDYYEIKANFDKSTVQNEDASSKYGSASLLTQIHGQKCTRRLPKLELTKFDGNAKNWLGFWSSFKKIHNDTSIDDDDKMAYLLQCMQEDSPAQNLVKSYPPCGENYNQAVEQLKSRYARDELLVEVYVRELLALVLQQSKQHSSMSISSLCDRLKTQLRALEVLGVTSEKYAAMLYPLVESALPTELLRVWERQRSKTENTDTLNDLLDFLKIEVESDERIKLTQQNFSSSEGEYSEEIKVPTAACLVSGDSKRPKSPINEKTCIWCDKTSHDSLECYKAQRMTLEARNELIAKKKACTLCLRLGHNFNKCKAKAKCIGCNKRHAFFLCPAIGKTGTASSKNNDVIATVNLSSKNINKLCDVKTSGIIEKYPDVTGIPGQYLPHDEIFQECLEAGVRFLEMILILLTWIVIVSCSTILKIKDFFNKPSSAPRWGGWWKVMTKMVKDLQRHNLGKTTDGYRQRVKHLNPIRISTNEDPIQETSRNEPKEPDKESPPPHEPVRTRSGRPVRVPRRLDI